MAKIRFRPVVPKRMNIRQMGRAIERALILEGNSIESLYRNVSDGFSSSATYKKTNIRSFRATGIRVSTDDVRMVNLDTGTNTRWAVMSKDFQPKTSVRRLSTRSGSGRTVIRGRKAMTARGIRPRPGIKARKFSEEIVAQRQRPFADRVQNAIDLAANNLY